MPVSALNTNAKPSYSEYSAWLASKARQGEVDRLKGLFDTTANQTFQNFIGSEFWKRAKATLREANDKYLIKNREELISNYEPAVVVKPFDSFFLKTFRKNVLSNPNWPEAPRGGWIIPPDCCTRINDIVRTTITVRYVDGVSLVVEALAKLAGELSLKFRSDFEGSIEGYYAAHLYVSIPVDVLQPDWSYNTEQVEVEIQITTQFKVILKSLLHEYYKRDRANFEVADWKWNFQSDAFTTHNLGHMLHFIEGLIVQMRDRQEKAQ